MKPTLEQHRRFGELTKQFREALMEPQIMCSHMKSSRESKAVMATLKKVDQLKDIFDSLVCRDFPEYPDATKVYYGMSQNYIQKQGGNAD